MFIHWRRRGWAVPVVGLGVPAGVQSIVDAAYGSGTYIAHSGVLAPLALGLAAAILYAVDARLLRRPLAPDRSDKVLTEYPDQAPTVSDGSAFVFIPVRWCAVIIGGLAVLASVPGLRD